MNGKGAQAASVTAMMRWTIRAAAAREASPSRVLEALNAALLSESTPGDFCTAIYGCLRADDLTLRFSIAGHPLPILRTAEGGADCIGEPGTLLGAIAEPSLHECEVKLSAGDMLLFYTDGVTESRTADGFFGTDRLRALAERCQGPDAEAVAREIEAAVVEATGTGMTDDIALLVLRALDQDASRSSTSLSRRRS